jgi:NADPH:quinone reductase-like Zn-dependent oxidoreductase
MRAHVMDNYGGPELLRQAEIDRPLPAAGEVLVHVAGTSINPLDAHEMRGEPWIMRLGKGWRRPKQHVRGNDVSGIVVASGDTADDDMVGTTVFGTATGSFADYAVAKVAHVAPAPTSIDPVTAAALPIAGLTALQAVRAARLPESGRLLVIGASGGVGTLAVQIAVAAGVHVTGVCSGPNLELVRSLGATEAIDYTAGELDPSAGPFDAIIDMIGSSRLHRCKQLLASKGTYVLIGGPDGGRLLGPLGGMIRAKLWFALGGRRARTPLATVRRDDLIELAGLVDAGVIRPVIDQLVAFDELVDAVRRLETHRARGKVIIQVAVSDGADLTDRPIHHVVP